MFGKPARPGRILLAASLPLLLLGLSTKLARANDSAPREPNERKRIQSWLDAEGMSGDWFGWRTRFSDAGFTPYAVWTGEVFRNFNGGLKTATDWAGMLEFGADVDLERTIGWNDTTFHASALWIHDNDDPSPDYVGGFDQISNIAGIATVRIYQLYLSKGLDEDRLRLKFGQVVLDDDFMISESALLFISSSFGALPVESANTPAPIYPLSALGAMAKWQPSRSLTLLMGLYNGDAASEKTNRNGLEYDFGRSEGVLAMAEIAVEARTLGRDATFKLGAYYDSGDFMDFDSGSTRSGNYALYFIADHALIGTRDENALAAFFRLGWSPLDDRNQVHWYFDVGITTRGFRASDRFGLGVSHTEFGSEFVSSQAVGGQSVVDDETIIELTYRARVTPWFELQPDFQFVIDPQNANASDAIVGGLRAKITF